MKPASYPRIFIATLAMTAIACSDPVAIEPPPPPPPQPDQTEYHTSVTTWVKSNEGNYMGLVTQMPNTDLSIADVFVVKDGMRIRVGRQWDAQAEPDSNTINGEYFWASYKNNVLLLNYIGVTPASPPPFPLEVIIVY